MAQLLLVNSQCLASASCLLSHTVRASAQTVGNNNSRPVTRVTAGCAAQLDIVAVWCLTSLINCCVRQPATGSGSGDSGDGDGGGRNQLANASKRNKHKFSQTMARAALPIRQSQCQCPLRPGPGPVSHSFIVWRSLIATVLSHTFRALWRTAARSGSGLAKQLLPSRPLLRVKPGNDSPFTCLSLPARVWAIHLSQPA